MKIDHPIWEESRFKAFFSIYANGKVFSKALPAASQEEREEQCAYSYVRYCMLRQNLEGEPVITGRDGENGQIHDFTFELPNGEHLFIEVTSISESADSYKSVHLQELALNQNELYGGNYFCFIPFDTSSKLLQQLFRDASREKDVIDIPEDYEQFRALIKELSESGAPLVKRVNSDIPHVHTYGGKIRTIGQAVRDEVKKKENKSLSYSGVAQDQVILLLEDRLLGYSREQITSVQPFLTFEHMPSPLREIHIISLKSDYVGRYRDYEFMLTPIKDKSDSNLFYSSVDFILKSRKEYPPMTY